MDLLKRMFGKSEPEAPQAVSPPAPQAVSPAVPRATDVLPGQLSVTVFTHEIPHALGDIPCWTYVTAGLRNLGQRELIFSLRRAADDGPDAFPSDPIEYFKVIHELASEGRLVDVGSCTGLSFSGSFLGTTGDIGFVYLTPEPLPGVNLPPLERALAVLLLTSDELAAVQSVGCYRVLTLLGQENLRYPHPIWSEASRASVLSKSDQSSTLLKMPRAFLREATVHLSLSSIGTGVEGNGKRSWDLTGHNFVLRIPRAHLKDMQTMVQAASPSGIAFLTDPDPEANVRLVWRPGQQGAQSITPASSDGSRITGGFIALLHGDPRINGGFLAEDGFCVMLGESDWNELRVALTTGEEISLPASDPGRAGLVLEWTGTATPAE